MRPGYVRCMINSPYRYYDAATGRYDRMRNLASLRRLLQYCQDNGITVAYGEYNPPTWAMKDSQQWVEMVGRLPEFSGLRPRVRLHPPFHHLQRTRRQLGLDRRRLRPVALDGAAFRRRNGPVSGPETKGVACGADVVMSYNEPGVGSTTRRDGWPGARRTSARRSASTTCMPIPGQHEVRSGAYAEKLRRIRAEVPAGKKLILGEAGYKYSAPEDSLLKAEYDPSGRRASLHQRLGLQHALLRLFLRAGYAAAGDGGDEQRPFGGGGVDARRRHAFERRFGPHGGREDLGNVEHPRRGGLRRRFAGGTAALVLHLVADVRHFPAGCDILACEVPQREGLRVAAARKDAAYSVAAVNFSQEPCTLEIVLPGDFAGGVLYRYTESDRACDANGFPAPCERGIAGKRFRTTVPAESFVLLTNVE